MNSFDHANFLLAKMQALAPRPMSEKGKTILRRLVLALLVYNFVASGALKIFGYKVVSDHFHRWGFPDWVRITVGSVELVAAALLLWKPARRIGAQIMVAVMGGAIATLLCHAESVEALGPICVIGILLLLDAMEDHPILPLMGAGRGGGQPGQFEQVTDAAGLRGIAVLLGMRLRTARRQPSLSKGGTGAFERPQN